MHSRASNFNPKDHYFPKQNELVCVRNKDAVPFFEVRNASLCAQQNLLGQRAARKLRKFSDVSETDSPPFFRIHLIMGTESVPEISENFHALTRLSGQKDFVEFCRREKLQDISLCTTLMKFISRSVRDFSLYRHLACLSIGTDGGSLICPYGNSYYYKLLCLFVCLLD